MRLRMLLMAAGLLLAATSAGAQTVAADQIRLNHGPCYERSGSGTPEGVQAGNPCDLWHDTATGLIYKKILGAGTTGWYRMVGPTSAPCSSFAGCVAAQLTLDTTLFQQQLRTDHAYTLRTFANTDGGHVEAYNGTGWIPAKVFGGPTQLQGGGVHIGQASTLDPGVGNADVDGYIGQPGFASQTTGWRIDQTGAADFRYLYTDELIAKSFITDLEQALAGGQIISKSVAQVGAPFTVPAPGSISTLTVKDLPSAPDMAVFESGDAIRIRTFSRASGSLTITDGWGTVTSYADLADGLQTWQFTRAIANGGSMTTGTVIAVDALVLDYGVSGNGFSEVNAIDGLYGVNSPYTQIVTWSGDTPIAANQTVRERCGNLRGITSVTGEYGCIFGTYAATNGRYIKASTEGLDLHGVDLALWNGSTKVMALDHLTPYFSMGTPAPTSYTSGTGCWSGLDAGVFKWRCGDPSGSTQIISWDGVQLTVAGNIVVTGTSIDASSVLGVPGATVNSGAARGLLGIDSNGNPLLPHTATPSGSGLFLGSDHLGYYASAAWKTYMDNTGGFYLGGSSGALQWNGTSLTITGTLAGNGASITSIAGGNITTGSITATQIAANTITAAKIAANTITASQIAAGTITATELAAGSVTASKINVSTLDAITANMGTVTAGTITGVTISGSTITAGGGALTMDGSGFLLTAGSGTANMLRWTDGTEIYTNGSTFTLTAGHDVILAATSGDAFLTGSSVYLQGTVRASGDIYLSPSTTTSNDYPMVFSTGQGHMYRKTNGYDGTCSSPSTIVIERGIITDCF